MSYDNIQFNFAWTITASEYEERMERRSEHIYTTFVESVLEEGFNGRAVFQPNEVQDELRAPYSYSEVKSALEYGVENVENIEVVEGDMDLFLYEED